mgnify:CR=1 FL=1
MPSKQQHQGYATPAQNTGPPHYTQAGHQHSQVPAQAPPNTDAPQPPCLLTSGATFYPNPNAQDSFTYNGSTQPDQAQWQTSQTTEDPNYPKTKMTPKQK